MRGGSTGAGVCDSREGTGRVTSRVTASGCGGSSCLRQGGLGYPGPRLQVPTSPTSPTPPTDPAPSSSTSARYSWQARSTQYLRLVILVPHQHHHVFYGSHNLKVNSPACSGRPGESFKFHAASGTPSGGDTLTLGVSCIHGSMHRHGRCTVVRHVGMGGGEGPGEGFEGT